MLTVIRKGVEWLPLNHLTEMTLGSARVGVFG